MPVLLLIFCSSIVDFFVCNYLKVTNNLKSRKALLLVSICVNLGLLGYFKYVNFFLQSFNDAFQLIGLPIGVQSLSIVLPVGISFYTFQTLSYTVDCYNKKIEPSSNIVSFLAYVSFLPQLVAGPIERAKQLLPQFETKRKFDSNFAAEGLIQILSGLVKKVIIADNCAIIANEIFNNYEVFNGPTLALGAIFFGFQIYGDFSGYSDIAIGTAKLFGFNLMQNFKHPYFALDIADFWRRWHISLSTWFRDYVYIPLGGSRGSKLNNFRNVCIVFLLSGLWHGANWTFIAWGGIHILLFFPLMFFNLNRKNTTDINKTDNKRWGIRFLSRIITFLFVTFGWIFFRSDSIGNAFSFIHGMFSWSSIQLSEASIIKPLILVIAFLSVEWFQRKREHFLDIRSLVQTRAIRWGIYLTLVLSLYVFGVNSDTFIYFQF